MTKKKKEFFSLGNKVLLIAIIAFASFAVYFNAIFNKYSIDDELIYENHVLKSLEFSTIKKIFKEPYYKDAAGNEYEYRPIVVLSFFIEYSIFGRSYECPDGRKTCPSARVSHFYNVLLFSISCVLIFSLLTKLFKDFKFAIALSFLVAMLFAVHPLHTEVVASIKSRDELLSLLFAVLSWFFALRFVDNKQSSIQFYLVLYYMFYLLFFVAALFSKQSTITFSILIPASLVIFRRVSVGDLLIMALPVILISTVFSPIYLLYKKVLLFVFANLFLLLFYLFISKRKETFDFLSGIKQRIAAFFSKLNYKLLAGVAAILLLVFIGGYYWVSSSEKLSEKFGQVQYSVQDKLHDYNELQLTPLLKQPAASVIPIAGRQLNFVEVPLLYEKNVWKKLGTSIYALGMYFKLMIIPHPLSFYYGYNQIPIADFSNGLVLLSLGVHFAMVLLMLYFFIRRVHLIAAFGLLFYLVSIVPLSNMITPIAGIIGERLAYASSLGFCLLFCYLIFYPLLNAGVKIFGWNRQKIVFVFNSLFALIILFFSILTIVRNEQWEDDLTLFRHDIGHLQNSARAHHLLASHLGFKVARNPGMEDSKKMLQESLVHFKKTLEIYSDFPNVWYELGKVYMLLHNNENTRDNNEKAGYIKNAIEAYATSVRKDTIRAHPSFEFGVVLEQQGRTAEAEQAYKIAVARDSLFVEAHTNLSFLYYKQGKYMESIAVNMRLLKNKPNAYEPNVNIGRTYLKIGDTNSALPYLEKAAAINSSDKQLMQLLSELFTRMGNAERAMYYRERR